MNDIPPLWQSENDHLKVTVHTDASADIVDRTTGTCWHMGHVALQETGPIEVGHVWLRTQRSRCEQFPGHFASERAGNYLRFTLLGRERQPVGRFTCVSGYMLLLTFKDGSARLVDLEPLITTAA